MNAARSGTLGFAESDRQRVSDLESRFAFAGFSGMASTERAAVCARVMNRLSTRLQDARIWWVPGRIEFLGKHTDYAGGPSLLCATEYGFVVVAAARTDSRMLVIDADGGGSAAGELRDAGTVRQSDWSNYPFTVARRVAANFPGLLRGVDLAFASDLPRAAGLSSSSALIVATFLALSDFNELPARSEYRDAIHSTEDLAGYLGAIENGSDYRSLAGNTGVGTQGGSEDHTAILCARPRALVQYRFAPISFERRLVMPDEQVLCVAVSGVIAEKTGNALAQYNRASRLAGDALRAWRVATGSTAPTLAAALDESPDGMERFRAVLAGQRELLDRVEHFHIECQLVRAAGDALASGDLDGLGALVDRSQDHAERLLGNQVPETIALARSARELGAVAASAFGAGFGGSVYALVHENDAADFLRQWRARYARAFPNRSENARFFSTRPGLAATRV